MVTMLKRLFWLALLGGAGFAVWSVLQRRNEGPPGAAADWPPLDTSEAAAPAAFADVASAADGGAAPATRSESGGDTGEVAAERWVAPDDGACPITHPIKANDNSGIYHVPGGRFYDRTGAERCYARADDAEADGYRAAKS